MSTTTRPRAATVAVVRHAFISAAEQMRRNLYRSAYSPIIYEMNDCAVGIFDSSGALLGQAPGLPFFLGSLGGTIQEIAPMLHEESAEGDVWVVNDSSICGSHLNDVTLVEPIFVDGHLRGFSGAKAHWMDVGAMETGSLSNSTNIFQEGLRLPPIRIVRSGQIDRSLVELLRRNSRYGR
jgi:N-methylhydantoinase B